MSRHPAAFQQYAEKEHYEPGEELFFIRLLWDVCENFDHKFLESEAGEEMCKCLMMDNEKLDEMLRGIERR